MLDNLKSEGVKTRERFRMVAQESQLREPELAQDLASYAVLTQMHRHGGGRTFGAVAARGPRMILAQRDEPLFEGGAVAFGAEVDDRASSFACDPCHRGVEGVARRPVGARGEVGEDIAQ